MATVVVGLLMWKDTTAMSLPGASPRNAHATTTTWYLSTEVQIPTVQIVRRRRTSFDRHGHQGTPRRLRSMRLEAAERQEQRKLSGTTGAPGSPPPPPTSPRFCSPHLTNVRLFWYVHKPQNSSRLFLLIRHLRFELFITSCEGVLIIPIRRTHPLHPNTSS